MVSASVVSGDKDFEGIHDVMMVLGLRPEDGNEAGAIIDSYKCLPIDGVVRSCRSKNTHWLIFVEGGERLVTCRSELWILPMAQAMQEPKNSVIRSMSWPVR